MPRAAIAGPWRRRTRPGSSSLRPASRSPGRQPAYLKALVRRTGCATRPSALRRRARPGERSSQTRSYSRTIWRPPPRSSARRAVDRLEQLGRAPAAPSCGRPGAAGSPRRPGAAGAGAAGSASRIRPRFVSGFDVVAAEVEALGEAVRLGLVAPAVEQRPDDAVRRGAGRSPGRAARDDSVEDGLDLVGGGVARRAQPVGRERVADLAQLVLGRPAAAVDDLGAEHVAAERRVLLRLRSAQSVVDVQRRDLVAELAQRVPEAGRVGAARDEAGHLAAGRDQPVPADVGLDRLPKARGSMAKASRSTQGSTDASRAMSRSDPDVSRQPCRRETLGERRLALATSEEHAAVGPRAASRSSRRGGSRARSRGGRRGTPTASARGAAGRGR